MPLKYWASSNVNGSQVSISVLGDGSTTVVNAPLTKSPFNINMNGKIPVSVKTNDTGYTPTLDVTGTILILTFSPAIGNGTIFNATVQLQYESE